MSRLINTEELLARAEHEANGMTGDFKDLLVPTLSWLINKTSTAYDLNKVVEELEKELSLADKEKERCAGENNLQFDSAKGYASGISTAIEIVKHGGVSDDVCEWKLEDEEANLYLTRCQQRQLIFEGTPKENGYIYCPYCGKKIKIVGD